MNERMDLSLREADGPNPPDLLKQLLNEVLEQLNDGVDSAGRWWKGKAEAEIAKAAEIKARVIQALSTIDQDRERLRQERESSERRAIQEGIQAEHAHQQRMYELRTQRLKDAIDSICRLKELGVQIEIQIIDNLVAQFTDAAEKQTKRKRRTPRPTKSIQAEELEARALPGSHKLIDIHLTGPTSSDS